jgi:hypothetical protein
MSNQQFIVENTFKLFKDMLLRHGDGKALSEVYGQDARGNECLELNLSKAPGQAWATGDLKVILCAVPGSSILPQSMQTQSHAFGTFLPSSSFFEMYLEGVNMSSTASLPAQIKFQMDCIHYFRGVNGAPVTLFLSQGLVPASPALSGFNGAVATVGTQIAVLAPYAVGANGGI